MYDRHPTETGNISSYEAPRLGWRGCAGFGILGLIFAMCFLVSTCVSTVEVMRATSPDGAITARVFEVNGGATTDFSYVVYINRNWPIRWNHQVAGYYGAGRSSCAYGVNVKWVGNDTLLITYKDAKSAFVEPTVTLFGRTIHTISRAGIDDPTAPCGGMEYAQAGRVVVR